MVFISENEIQTYELGLSLGKSAESNSVFCLYGDLGVGKTAFAKGFAKGLSVTEDVTSPTFAIVNEYSGRIPFYHFDVYRINSIDEMFDTGYDEYISAGGCCLIEWADLIEEILPQDAIKVYIEKDYLKHENYRKIVVKGIKQ